MAYRKTPLVTNHFYHVFNRGVNRQPIFFDLRDYRQYLLEIEYYQFSKPPVRLSHYKHLNKDKRDSLQSFLGSANQKLIDIICFVLMPNHVHFLMQQLQDKGISAFMSKITNSYTKHCNIRHNRVGHLFQGTFKAVRIESNDQLVHVSRYIHLNPVVSGLVASAEVNSYRWSSLPQYLETESIEISNPAPILSHFPSPQKYLKFVQDQADCAKKLELIKHITTEIEESPGSISNLSSTFA